MLHLGYWLFMLLITLLIVVLYLLPVAISGFIYTLLVSLLVIASAIYVDKTK